MSPVGREVFRCRDRGTARGSLRRQGEPSQSPTHGNKGGVMASDFQISIERERDCLRLELSGDFDEQSAESLIERLRKE